MHTAFPSFLRFFGRQKRKKSRLKFAFWQLFLWGFLLLGAFMGSKKAAFGRLSRNPLIGFLTAKLSPGQFSLSS